MQQIVLVPLLMSAWGNTLYTDWIVLFAAANFVPMLELGTQAYFGNLLLAAWSSGARARFDAVLGHCFVVQLAIVLLACIAAALSPFVVDWPAALGAKVLSHRDALLILLLLSAGNLATVPQGVMSTIYRARGEFSRLVNVVTLLLALETAGMALAVLAGGSPVATAAIYTTSIGLAWVLMIVDQRRRYRDLRYRLRWPRRPELRHLVTTVPFYLVTTATTTAIANAPIVLLQIVAPGSAIVAFATSRLLVGILRQLTHQTAHASGVEMARQLIQDETVALRRLFGQTGVLVGAIYGLFGGALLVIAGPFFQIWTRGNVALEPALFIALLANVYVILPGQAALTLLYYSNRPQSISVYSACHAVAGLALAAVLAPRFGATGAAAALAVTEGMIMGLWLARVGARLVGVPFGSYLLKTYASGTASFVISAGVADAIAHILPPTTLPNLLAFGAVWAAAIGGPTVFVLLPMRPRRAIVESLRREAKRRVASWRIRVEG